MKYLLIISITMICVASSFWGCQKEDLGNLDGIFSDTAQGPVSKMSALVNDTQWTAVSTDFTLQPGQISITGTDAEGEKIMITLYSSASGDYLIRPAGTNVGKYAPDSITLPANYLTTNANVNTGGVVNIQSIDTVNELMSGDFNLIVAKNKETKTITEGVFSNISYTNLSIKYPFSVTKKKQLWIPTTASAKLNGNTLTIYASKNDTSITLIMPANISPAAKPYPILPLAGTSTCSASVTENNYTLNADTSKVLLKDYRITSSLTILSNTNGRIEGAFSFLATYYKNGKIIIATPFNSGTFNLTY